MLKFIKNCAVYIMILGLGLFSWVHAIDYPDEYDSQPVEVSYGRGEWQISDEDLINKVRYEIKSGWFLKGYDQITVQAKNGVVTLQGVVKTQEDKKDIEKEVSKIKGVKKIDSQIVVEENLE